MRKKIATVPVLVTPEKGDWYVYFSVRNPLTGKMVPQKIYRGFKQCGSIAEKRRWGTRLVSEYTEKLKQGWSPLYDDTRVIYSDELEYHHLASQLSKIKKTVKNSRYYLSDFLVWKQPTVSKKTYETYTSKIRIFCSWIENSGYGDYDVSSINNKIILDFFNFLIVDQKLDRVTVIKYMQMVREYFRYLLNKGKISVNPVFDVPIPVKTKDCAARPINDADIRLLLEAARVQDPQLYMAMLFQFYLALRPGSEMRLMKIMDLDLYNKIATVVYENAKKDRRTIDIPVQLVKLCREFGIDGYNREFFIFGRKHCPGPEPVGKNTLPKRFNMLRTQLGLPSIYKFYSWKHTGAGKLLASGRTIEEIKRHLGHAHIESTDYYVRRHFGNRNEKIINEYPDPC